MNNEMDIVMTQWTALRGSFILAKQYKDRLSSHIPSSFIARVLEYEEYLNVDLEERIVKKFSDQIGRASCRERVLRLV